MKRHDHHTLTDEELIRRYLETQSSRWFDVLYQRYFSRVYSKCLSMLGDRGIAEDTTQDIFMKLFTRLVKFEGKSKFSTWVYSVTYNHCIDLIRRGKSRQQIVQVEDLNKLPERVDEISDAALLELKVHELERALKAIKPDDRAILLMKYQDGMSIKEIGSALRKSDSAVKMQLKRAKARVYELARPGSE